MNEAVVVVVLVTLVALVWRGIWGLSDLYIYKEDKEKSYGISLILGLGALYYFDKMNYLISIRDEGAAKKLCRCSQRLRIQLPIRRIWSKPAVGREHR